MMLLNSEASVSRPAARTLIWYVLAYCGPANRRRCLRRRCDVLLAQRVDDVACGDLPSPPAAGGSDPEAHRILPLAEDDDVCHARHALDGVPSRRRRDSSTGTASRIRPCSEYTPAARMKLLADF